MLEGWYYLHTNKDLIYKKEMGGTAADIRESSFALMLWPVDPSDRLMAWNILIESLSLGAKKERVFELAKKWSCDNKDAEIYAEKIGCNLSMDGDSFCATHKGFIDLQESIAGFGDTALEALSNLCKNSDWRTSKMWGISFSDFLKKESVGK